MVLAVPADKSLAWFWLYLQTNHLHGFGCTYLQTNLLHGFGCTCKQICCMVLAVPANKSLAWFWLYLQTNLLHGFGCTCRQISCMVLAVPANKYLAGFWLYLQINLLHGFGCTCRQIPCMVLAVPADKSLAWFWLYLPTTNHSVLPLLLTQFNGPMAPIAERGHQRTWQGQHTQRAYCLRILSARCTCVGQVWKNKWLLKMMFVFFLISSLRHGYCV